MGLGELGALISAFAEAVAIPGLLIVFLRNPKSKQLAEDDFRGGLGALFALILGNTLMYIDPTYEPTKNWWILALSPVAFSALVIITIISYRRLKRFEQEEMLERLAEKMGEKLGESMAKSLKAKEP